MQLQELEEALAQCRGVRVAIIGDFCLDVYWVIDPCAAEVSLETGHLTQPVVAQRESLGGAGNIANNLATLGVASVRAIGAIGSDLFGQRLRQLLEREGIDCRQLAVADSPWATPVYIKPHVGDLEGPRFDLGMLNQLSPPLEKGLCKNIESATEMADSIIINCQLQHSIYGDSLVGCLNSLIAKHPRKVFLVDSRHNADQFRGAYMKANAKEASRLAGKESGPLSSHGDLASCADAIQAAYDFRGIIITWGESGIFWHSGGRNGVAPGVPVTGPIDPVGAGDTVCAYLAALLGAGISLPEACEIANLAASVTVRKLRQCGTASREEVLAARRNLE